MNDVILHRIANTIVANLENTESNGLVNGKMGLCLFLYKYAKFSNKPDYKDVADQLLQDIYCSEHSDMPYNLQDGYAGMGIGLCWLLKHNLLKGNADHVLTDVDDALLSGMRQCMKQDLMYCSKLSSAGSYLIHRMQLNEFGRKNEFVDKFLKETCNLIDGIHISRKQINLLGSLECALRKIAEAYKGCLEEISGIIARLDQVKESCKKDISAHEVTIDEQIANLWTAFINADCNIALSLEDIRKMTEELIVQYPYRMDTINNALAIIGLYTLDETKEYGY